MKKYKVVKENKKNESKKIEDGYVFKPKKNTKTKINTITVYDNKLISKIIKRKIKYHLDKYLKIILDNLDSEDDSSEKTLMDLKKYNRFIKKKYSIYLDKEYMDLLNKRIKVISKELENNIKNKYENEYENDYEKEEEHRRRR